MVLKIFFEYFIDPTFHSDSRGLATKVFRTTPPVDVLANLQRLYRKPRYQELDVALLRLNNPMHRMQPVEVMLRGIKELQLLLLANIDEDRALTKPNLISYTLIKLTKTGGMYAKGIEK